MAERRRWRAESLQTLREIVELPWDGPRTTAGENRDCASVMRSRCEGATDSLLDLTGSVLAGEQQHIDQHYSMLIGKGFYLSLRDSVDAAADLLSMPMPPGPSSDAWFEAGERLHRACRRLGSATYCLHEWAEPPEDQADSDDGSEPSDAGLPVDARRRREARRAGRRNPSWWHDSQSTF